MLTSKTTVGNVSIGAGATAATGTWILDVLNIIDSHSVAIGLLVSACGVFGGLVVNVYYRQKELNELRRHNRAMETKQ